MISRIITGFSVLLIGMFAVLYFCFPKTETKTKYEMKIKEVVKIKTVTKFIKKKPAEMTVKELTDCANNTIDITYRVEPTESKNGDTRIRVTATDGCKLTDEIILPKYTIREKDEYKKDMAYSAGMGVVFGFGAGCLFRSLLPAVILLF